MAIIQSTIQRLTRFSDRPWFPIVLGFLALIDFFILVLPADWILVSSVILNPKHWPPIAIAMTIGSTVAALVLAGLIDWHGMEVVTYLFPDLTQVPLWLWLESVFQDYGLALILGISATPLMIQPVIVIACLAEVPIKELIAIVFVGRLIKCGALAYMASHAPKYVSAVSRWL